MEHPKVDTLVNLILIPRPSKAGLYSGNSRITWQGYWAGKRWRLIKGNGCPSLSSHKVESWSYQSQKINKED